MLKRLLIVTHQFPSAAAPTFAMYNRQQFEALSTYYQIDLVVPVDWLTWVRKGKAARTSDNKTHPHYVPYFHTPKMLRRFYSAFMKWSLARVLADEIRQTPDAVLATWAYPDATAVVDIFESSHIPVFVKVHGSDINVYCEKPALCHQIVGALSNAAKVFCVSQALRDKLVSVGVPESKTAVVYNGVNRKKFMLLDRREARRSVGLNEDGLVFIFLGNLLETKGAVDLAHAFQLFSNRCQQTKMSLVYIGDGSGRAKIQTVCSSMAAESGNANIKIVGRKNHDELNGWLNAADFVCLPSYNEGVPNALLEAMSCGTPVIASAVGGIPEVVTPEVGVLTRPGDIEGIADAMRRAVEQNWSRTAIREHTVRFDWDVNARQIRDVIDETLSI